MVERKKAHCKNCGERIHYNVVGDKWWHWDSYRHCLKGNTMAEPLPEEVEASETEKQKDIILSVLAAHSQSVRNKRCICGHWQPDWNDRKANELFPEYRQHREHVAEEITNALEGTRN